MRRLTTLFPSEYLEEHAEELGVVEREGKLQIPVLVWSLVFGFAAGEDRTLAGFRRSYNATDQTIERIDVTDEKTHDSTLFKTGSWLHGRLVLLDLAYFKYRRFALIDENGGYFVSRLKENANPVITEELREWRGRAIPLEGEQIQDIVGDLSRKYIDVAVEAEFKRGPYNGTQSLDTKRFRVVGVRRRYPVLNTPTTTSHPWEVIRI
jgi:IS4 transposase